MNNGPAVPPPIKVVVVDDEAELRALLQRYLTGRGFVVRVAADATQLDRLLQRESYDMLVLDLALPGEDGLSICRRLRAQGETIPILMLTARGDPVDRIVGLEMGAHDATDRSIDVQVLRLRRLIEADPAKPRYIQTVRNVGYVFIAVAATS